MVAARTRGGAALFQQPQPISPQGIAGAPTRTLAQRSTACHRILRLACSLLGGVILAGASEARGAVVTAAFNSADDIPIVASSYIAVGNSIELSLNFAIAVPTRLTVIKNTGRSSIAGAFSNLAHGQRVTLAYGGAGYPFYANYFGGTGRDLVLEWAGTRAFSWGYEGVIGRNASRRIPGPVIATSAALRGKTIVRAAAGFLHGLVLCSDNTLAAWGNNGSGQLGTNTTIDRPTAVLVSRDDGVSALYNKGVADISVGNYHSLALCTDGTVVAWGANDYGQLGDGTTTQRNAPVAVSRAAGSALAGKTVIAIKAGANFSLALCSDGKVVAWGLNLNGQLGDGTKDNRLLPVFVNAAAGSALAGRTAVALAAGNYHAMALCSDGAVAAWGLNTDGQLGQANVVTAEVSNGTYTVSDDYAEGKTFGKLTTYSEFFDRLIPGLVSTAPNVSALAGKTVVAIHAGLAHSYALCSDGTVAAWGDNVSGDLGNIAFGKQQFPVAVDRSGSSALGHRTVVAIGGGRYFGLALCSDGALVAWGENAEGEIGDDTTAPRTLPTVVNASQLSTGERVLALGVGGSESIFSLALVAPPPAADIAVLGNDIAIASGSTTPASADGTDFGANSGSTPIVKTFTIASAGAGQLVLGGSPRVTISGDQAADFTVTAQPASPLDGGTGSTTFQISFLAGGGGTRKAKVSIATNVGPDPADPFNFAKNPFTFAIQGTGPQPSIAVLGNATAIANNAFTPSTDNDTDFGNTSFTAPITRTFTIKNTGTQPLTLSGSPFVSIQNSTASDFVVTTPPTSPIAAGASTTFQLRFTPSTQSASKAWLTIASDDPSNASYRFAVTGTGATPVISVTGNSATIANGDAAPAIADLTDFDTGPLNTAIAHTFTIANSGGVALTLSGTPRVTLVGPDAADFSVATQPASSTVAANGTATFKVNYTPAVVGKRSTASVVVASNDPLTPSYSFALQGTGPTPSMSVTGNSVAIASGDLIPSPVDFTEFGVTTLATPVTRTFTITNSGLAPLTLSGSPKIAISGANAADFTVTTQPASSVAASSGSTTFTISFLPGAAGVRTAMISIANNQPLATPFIFAVSGAGPVPTLAVLGNGVAIANGSASTTTNNFTEFGQVESGGDPIVRTFTLRNDGSTPLTLAGAPIVKLTGATGDFSVTQQPAVTTLAGGGAATTTFQVTFNPTASGTRAAVVSIGSDDPRQNPFSFTLTASGPFAGTTGYVATQESGNRPILLSDTLKVQAIAAGLDFMLALGTDGKVYSWGANSTGQLGDGSGLSHSDIRPVSTAGALSGKTVIAIAAGGGHALALTNDGQVFGWGLNNFSQLGLQNVGSSLPVAIPPGELAGKTVVAIAASTYASFALTSEGKYYFWGLEADTYFNGRTSVQPRLVGNTGPLASDESVKYIAPFAFISSASRIFIYTAGGNPDDMDTSPTELLPLENESYPGDRPLTAIANTSFGNGMALGANGKPYIWANEVLAYDVAARLLTPGPLATKTVTEIAATMPSGDLNPRFFTLTSDGEVYAIDGADGEGGIQTVDLSDPSLAGRKPVKLFTSFCGTHFAAIVSDGPPRPTTGADDAYLVTNSASATVVPAATGVLANDTGTALAAALVASVQHGTLTLAADGGFTYTPVPGFTGTDFFTYNTVNSLGSAGPNIVTLTVTAINSAPTLTLASTAITVAQNSAPYALGKNFTTFSVGPAADGWQTLLGYTLTTDNDALFLAPPAIATNGTLTFTPARGARGVANVTVVARDNGGATGGGVDSVTKTFTLTIAAINDTPSLTLATDYLVVPAGGGAFSQSGFATFSPGRPDEAAQTLLGGYTVTNNNHAFFATQPAIAADGTLAFTLAADASGVAVVSVNARDSGGTANGAVDNVTKTFNVGLTSANVAPTLTFAAPAVAVLRDSAAYTSSGAFATFSPGPAGESAQTLLGGYRVSDDNPGLFTVQPQLSASGVLTFTPAPNARGSTTVTVVVQDSGGTENGGTDTTTRTFALAVDAPNSAPSVAFAAPKVTAPKNAGAQSLANFATFSPGPAADAGQALLGYTVTASANALFAVQPALTNSGTLTFTPAADAVGSATIAVVVQDDGGTAGGGADSSTATFTLELKPAAGTIVVTTSADAGPGSLRQAILDANASGSAVTILLLNNLGTFTPATPLPTITGQLTLNGGSGNRVDATLTVGAGGSLDLGGTKLTGASLVVGAGGKLVGSGESDGELVVADGGTLSPGASPGVLGFDSATWNNGGTYLWEISDATGEAGVATDLLRLASTLTTAATVEHPFTIKVRTLTTGFAAGAMANFDPTQPYFWTLVRFTPAAGQPSPVGGYLVGFDGAAYRIDASDFANATAGGRFALFATGNELQLAFIPNLAPLVFDDAYEADQGGALAPKVAEGVQFNDYDANLNALTATVATAPAHGQLVLAANGSFTYTPDAAFYGTDTFTYRANDGLLDSPSAATVTVRVLARPINLAPAAPTLSLNTPLSFTGALAISVGDPDSTRLTVDLTVSHGTLALTTITGLTLAHGASGAHLALAGPIADLNAALATLTYTPATDYAGADTLTFATTDEGNRTNADHGSVALSIATPNLATYHSADTNGDGAISLSELTRVIELYNTRNGTTRTGEYHTAATTTEDGYEPGAGAITGSYHSADENHDGKIDLGELTRVIELYNTRSGTTRTGLYHQENGTEDGYAPGPANNG